ncbi:MAG: ABC transporter ATP-binding protein [Oscillospiraceae bacterium]|nr:ABC transporter ATP-binding protein [Oscillospiraceae bacterium]
MEKAFEIHGLNKEYKGFALKNVNLELPKGYIMGFIGKNGAGKSTTMNCLLGITKPDSGDVKIFGKETKKLSPAEKEKIGVVLDGCPFAEILTVKDIEAVQRGIYKNWDRETFAALAKRFGLPWNKPIKAFSTGMRAKLNIASALSHHASLLVLDEATSGLDPVVRDEILDILQDFVQDENNSVLISSHITSDLEKICDYIAFIRDGQIVFVEEKDVLLEKFAVVHLTNEQFAAMDKTAVISHRHNSFSTQALVLKEKLTGEYVTDKPSIEDIMLYYTKEEQ